MKSRAVQPLLYGVCAYVASLAECEVTARDITQPMSKPLVALFRLHQRRSSLSHLTRRVPVVTVDRDSERFQRLSEPLSAVTTATGAIYKGALGIFRQLG
jgi:hypothetical protein